MAGIQAIGAAGASACGVAGMAALGPAAGMSASSIDMSAAPGGQAVSAQFSSISRETGGLDVFAAALVGLLLGRSENDDKKSDPLALLAGLAMLGAMQQLGGFSSGCVSSSFTAYGVESATGVSGAAVDVAA